MSEITTAQNLDSHYSTNAKVQRPLHPVAMAPGELPKVHLFNDTDAKNRLNAINQDIYIDSKKEENKHGIKFVKVFGTFVLGILAFLGLKKVFKKS